MGIKPMPIGSVYGRLKTIAEPTVKEVGKHRYAYVRCQCSCGTHIETRCAWLRYGSTKSCGCLKPEAVRLHATRHGGCPRQGDKRLYRIWANMRQRCSNPKNTHWADYGGRGISVCVEWQASFVAFRDWAMTHGYATTLEIDRVSNGGNYEPSNCRWVGRVSNMNNTRRSVHFEFFGEQKGLREWARDPRCRITYGALRKRMSTAKVTDERIMQLDYPYGGYLA